MPELRRDPIVNRWVIIATERAKRPPIDVAQPISVRAGICPFCPGQESKTPREVLAYRPSDGAGARANAPGWNLRVFPNRFPALMIEGDLDRQGDGLYDRMNGLGAHEVMVETADHSRSLAELSSLEVEAVLCAYRDRILDLSRDTRFRYVMVFKNHGAAAGATIQHSHSQLIALPVVPKTVSDELHGALEYHRFKERCVFCDILRQEQKDRSRLVYENGEFVVFEPYAPKFPFETWIMPRRHRAAYEDSARHELTALSDALRVTLHKLNRALDNPAYNFMLHNSPLGSGSLPHYHWHMVIMPTLAPVAGFEWGSGFYINPTPPEEAAHYLREVDL